MKPLYNLAGITCVGLGFAGLFLPLVPTTPFLLLAAFCFSRGSPALHRWLIEHPTMGPIIRDWNEHRVIRPRVKWMAAIMITVLIGATVVFSSAAWPIKALSALIGTGVIVMLFTRRSRPQ